jgi:hypothetical protein
VVEWENNRGATTMTYTITTTTLTAQRTTTTGVPVTITTTQYGTLSAGRSTDVRDNQVFTFPNKIYAVTDMYFSSYWNEAWYYYKIAYKLAYVKVVNYWNTTETLAYTDGPSTLYVRADRPLGIAAVYVFDGVSETIPPPPPPPPPAGPCTEIKLNPYCTSEDAKGKVDVETPLFEEVPCGYFGPNGENYRTTITATTNDEKLQWIYNHCPESWGPVPVDQTTPCKKTATLDLRINTSVTTRDMGLRPLRAMKGYKHRRSCNGRDRKNSVGGAACDGHAGSNNCGEG